MSSDTAVQTLDTLLQQALTSGASDIHLESGEGTFRARFRIDGFLHIVATPALTLRDAVVSRIKVLARMDIAEKRLPQDGRFQYTHQNQSIDLRVSSLPTIYGEKIVIRLLNFSRERPSLASLGYESDDEAKLLKAIAQPHGLILMTGPTGSGKTLSLYSCLDLLNRTDINISTVEDPCEIHLAGVNQVNINEKAGLTFANSLRALLRQDPDVLMVGEIRDLETAEIAIQAAQTGHLVLSTLHTNDAPGTLARLRHMGVPAFQIAASVRMITAQRLVRRLCEECKQPLSAQEVTVLLNQLEEQVIPEAMREQATPYKAYGCQACDKGYKGRIGLYQVLPVSESMRSRIILNDEAESLTAQAMAEGMRTLRHAGWLKVLQGMTTLDEVTAQTHHG